MIEYIQLTPTAVELYEKIYKLILKYVDAYGIVDDRLIRYTIKQIDIENKIKDSQEWNVCYKLRKYPINKINYKNLTLSPEEDNEEYTLKENQNTIHFRSELNKLIIDYTNELNLKFVLESNLKFYTACHMNLYMKTQNFRLVKNFLSRMPFHIDSSKYTLIQQNVKGLIVEDTRSIAGINQLSKFLGKLKHKVELGYDERFSISTFVFEIGTDNENDRLKHEVERDSKFIIKNT